MSDNFSKVVRLGQAKPAWTKRGYDVFCKVEYHNGRLSITGVEGPLASGNARGSCGQIGMSRPHIDKLAPGWTRAKLARFWEVWDAWHLNDTQAGTPEQMTYLEAHKSEYEQNKQQWNYDHYAWAQRSLSVAGLLDVPDPRDTSKTYRYGHAWLSVSVPDDVISFLQSLPSTDKQPAWV